jgi:hypothetical protein
MKETVCIIMQKVVLKTGVHSTGGMIKAVEEATAVDGNALFPN